MRILTTGGNGFLGLNWALSWCEEHELAIVTREVQVKSEKFTTFSLRTHTLRELVATYKPDLIVNAAAYTDVDGCERDPERALDANCGFVSEVLDAIEGTDVKLVHISTDHLFSGDSQFAREGDQPQPLNVYANTKLVAEKILQSRAPNSLILRTNFFGWGHKNKASFSDWVINSLQNGETIGVFEDVYITPVYVEDLFRMTRALLENSASGIVNIANSERISKLELALIIAEQFDLDASLIKTTRLKDKKLVAPRPHDMSLSNEKASQLGAGVPEGVRHAVGQLKLDKQRKGLLNGAL